MPRAASTPSLLLFRPGDRVLVRDGVIAQHRGPDVVASVDPDGLITLESGPRVHPDWLTIPQPPRR